MNVTAINAPALAVAAVPVGSYEESFVGFIHGCSASAGPGSADFAAVAPSAGNALRRHAGNPAAAEVTNAHYHRAGTSGAQRWMHHRDGATEGAITMFDWLNKLDRHFPVRYSFWLL